MRGHRYSLPRTHDELGLMAAILTGSADLRGAACVGRTALFDPDVPAESLGHADESARWEETQRVCQSCPARAACWAWASELPSGRVSGPVATTTVNPVCMRRRSTDISTTNTGRPA